MEGVGYSVSLRQSNYCSACPISIIESGYTGSDGRFSFSKSIDSAVFENNYLHVALASPSGYISQPSLIAPAVSPGEDTLVPRSP